MNFLFCSGFIVDDRAFCCLMESFGIVNERDVRLDEFASCFDTSIGILLCIQRSLEPELNLRIGTSIFVIVIRRFCPRFYDAR